MTEDIVIIQQRRRVLVNTDPQRRCYNGHHAKSEVVWTPWEDLESGVSEDRIKFWQELNEYAISQRGAEARREFRVLKIGE